MRRLYELMRERFRTGRTGRTDRRDSLERADLARRRWASGLAFAAGRLLFTAPAASRSGTAFLIYFYTQLLFQPLHMISNQLDDFQKASAGIARVAGIAEHRAAPWPTGRAPPLPAGPLAVEFRGRALRLRGATSRCCTTCRSASRPARCWACWAAPAAARRRSPACCCASTTRRGRIAPGRRATARRAAGRAAPADRHGHAGCAAFPRPPCATI